MIAIELKDVRKAFKDVNAVNGVSFSIEEGEFVALLGPNGAGKTTLVEMIEGIQKPDKGSIQILGKTWSSHEMDIRNFLGFSLQETNFIDKLTVGETIALFGSFYTIPQTIAVRSLEITSLTNKLNSYVENLSGGQKQKLALSIALVNQPKILILDEPTTGLDPQARRDIWNILLELKAKGTTLILTTHYMEEAETLCDRILFLDQGKIIAEGNLEELLEKNDLSESVDFEFEQVYPKFKLPKINGFKKIIWKEKNKSGKIIVKDMIQFLPKFLSEMKRSKIKLKSFECKKMTLDDLFLSMTGRRLEEE
ncbi:MAG: ABC transporter ATP-binding protein [Leptospiraceae bacterium]|nr:ABC transporter ATP-binding protein [Leptospiraceae bacterium]